MSWKHFKPVPQDATLSFGGYSFVNPEAWEKYLDQVIQEEYPEYFSELQNGRWDNSPWKYQESCILTSLESYLFHEFGIFVPEENLFKVFNRDGKGLELADLLEAVSAVIEPHGLEVDLILAVDPDIKKSIGECGRLVDETQAPLVEGKPGICMINVENGYNHAFFWPKIDSRSVRHKKFRLIILVKKNLEAEISQRSAGRSLRSFISYFQDTVRFHLMSHKAGTSFPEEILLEIRELENFCSYEDQIWDEELRVQIDQHLVLLFEAYRHYSSRNSKVDLGNGEPTRTLLGAGQMIRKVVRESL